MADESRKRKRMESNRESARRSRVKKQHQLQQVISDIDLFKRQNALLATKINETRQRCSAVETEIETVSLQKMDLEKRLVQLNSIIEKTEAGEISVESPTPIWRVDSWSDFSMNRGDVMMSCGDSAGGHWMEDLGIDFDVSFSPWRSAATMSRT